MMVGDLVALARRKHYDCEDAWYACPKSDGGCPDPRYKAGECNCGADQHNAKVDMLAASIREKLETVPSGDLRAHCVLGADGWHVIANPHVVDLECVKTACGSAIVWASRVDVRAPDCLSCREVLRGWARHRAALTGNSMMP